MRIGLFIPCYIDAFFPEVGIATLELLERFGHEVVYPRDQTCCGQPMANSGFNADCADTEALFVRNFSGFDYVVAPSGSCVHHVRDNFDAIEQTAEVKEVRARSYELVEFLHDIQEGRGVPWASFPHRVGLHNSCGTLRALKHAAPSELQRAVLLEAHGPALEGRGHRVRHSGATGRMLRLRRHLLGLRGGRLRQDGLRQGQRSRPRRRRVHRLRRQLLPDASATPASPRSLQNQASLGQQLANFGPSGRLRRQCHEEPGNKHYARRTRLLAVLRGTYGTGCGSLCIWPWARYPGQLGACVRQHRIPAWPAVAA